MAFSELDYMTAMTAEQRMLFQSQYVNAKKDRTVALLLTLFLGGLGAHRFYMGQVGLGIVYLVFCWTLVPAMIAFVELFLIFGRVDRHNQALAFELAQKVKLLATVS
jgi:TM2 domain-containing membrane protein YozV